MNTHQLWYQLDTERMLHDIIWLFAKMMSTRGLLKMAQNLLEGKARCQLPTALGPCGLSKLSCGTCVCHSEGKYFETSVSNDFLSNEFFKDSTEQHRCASIAP